MKTINKITRTLTALLGTEYAVGRDSTGDFKILTENLFKKIAKDFSVGNDKFTVTSASGKTAIADTTEQSGTAGALTVAGGVYIAKKLKSLGNFTVGADKFTVAASTGNFVSEGTGVVKGNFTVNTNVLFVDAANNKMGMSTLSPLSDMGGLDIASGRLSLIIGADSSARGTRTDATPKYGRIGVVHYTNSERPVCALMGVNGAGTNIVYIGGGTSLLNAATDLYFYTAGTTTTLTGTLAVRINSYQNVLIGGSANRGTTIGTRALQIFNGTAPAGTLTNGISIYSSGGVGFVMDAAGVETQLSPHDDANKWIFNSRDTVNKKGLLIHVEDILRFINDKYELNLIEDYTYTENENNEITKKEAN